MTKFSYSDYFSQFRNGRRKCLADLSRQQGDSRRGGSPEPPEWVFVGAGDPFIVAWSAFCVCGVVVVWTGAFQISFTAQGNFREKDWRMMFPMCNHPTLLCLSSLVGMLILWFLPSGVEMWKPSIIWQHPHPTACWRKTKMDGFLCMMLPILGRLDA